MIGDWDWESAISYSKAEKEDITRNRVSNTLMQEALNDLSISASNLAIVMKEFNFNISDSSIKRWRASNVK